MSRRSAENSPGERFEEEAAQQLLRESMKTRQSHSEQGAPGTSKATMVEDPSSSSTPDIESALDLPSGGTGWEHLAQNYRRPHSEGKWWSVSPESWLSITNTTRLKTLEHIGRIMETADGVDVPLPCDYCKSKGYSDCRVYSEAASQRGNTRVGCARCIRAKRNTRCSLATGPALEEVAQLRMRVSMLESRLSTIESSNSPQRDLGGADAWLDVWED